MSIANELNWTTASKPKFGKATEHSGAKKGKGAWDKKKVAKKGSNKGRRAGGKQEIKDQTVGDESDGPFPGSAPLFKKAAAMNWTTAEPRPCYPSEEPVEDHCNDGIAPPAPGGGDDMGETGWDQDPEQGYNPADDGGELQDDFLELGEDPMENAGPASPDGMGPQGRTPSPDGMGPQGRDGQQMTGPHDARDPSLAPDAPHQFWAQDSPHVQDALNKYLMPQLNSPNPEIAQKAQRILREGPHAE
jgi:hypothetical protein